MSGRRVAARKGLRTPDAGMARASYRLLVVAACQLLGGCGTAPVAPVADAGEPPLDAPVDLPPDFIVSTNEPFWQVTVDGAKVTLKGLEGTRTLVLASNARVFDGRVASARDAAGSVEVRIAGRACQDSMSGAWFPWTARLVLDGAAPVTGCARALGDPPPAEPR